MIRPILCYDQNFRVHLMEIKIFFRNKDGIAKFLDSLDIEKVHIQSSNNLLLQEALAVSEDLHKERIFTWFSFFYSVKW